MLLELDSALARRESMCDAWIRLQQKESSRDIVLEGLRQEIIRYITLHLRGLHVACRTFHCRSVIDPPSGREPDPPSSRASHDTRAPRPMTKPLFLNL